MTTTTSEATTGDLPAPVARVLRELVDGAGAAFGPDLVSVVLYGSAADGRLRATSDVNVILVLKAFEPAAVDRLRETLRLAQAAVALQPMFLLDSEVPAAAEAFANKFSDVARRHRVLFGSDPFAGLAVPRAATVQRLKQVLLNLTIRMRALYAVRSLREEQLALVVAEEAGPLRAAAATLLELEGRPAPSPKEALERVVAGFGDQALSSVLPRLSEARETRRLAPGAGGPTLLALIEISGAMRARAEALH
jgi:hypothetical protein